MNTNYTAARAIYITNLIKNEMDKISHWLSIIHRIMHIYPKIIFIALG
jgi:hypothetical protein